MRVVGTRNRRARVGGARGTTRGARAAAAPGRCGVPAAARRGDGAGPLPFVANGRGGICMRPERQAAQPMGGGGAGHAPHEGAVRGAMSARCGAAPPHRDAVGWGHAGRYRFSGGSSDRTLLSALPLPYLEPPRTAPHRAPRASGARSPLALCKRAAVSRFAAPWASAKTAEFCVCSKDAHYRGITHAYMQRFPRRLTRTPLLAAARGGAREPRVSFGRFILPKERSRETRPRRAPAPCAAPWRRAVSEARHRIWKGRAWFPPVPGALRRGEGLSAFGAPGKISALASPRVSRAGQRAHRLGLQNRGRSSGCADGGAVSPGGRGTAGSTSAHRAPLAFHHPSAITTTTRLNFGLFWDS